MTKTFFTSDTHFGHKNVIEFCSRPFESVEEMTDGLIKRWNDQVTDDDVVYHLGDFFFMHKPLQVKEILWQLKGKIHLVIGNHDEVFKKSKSLLERFETAQQYTEIAVKKPDGWISPERSQDEESVKICMMHYPIYEWNKMHHGSIHLHGHLHGQPTGISGRILDVGVDTNGMALYELNDILKQMNEKPIRHHGFNRSKEKN